LRCVVFPIANISDFALVIKGSTNISKGALAKRK